MITNQDRDVIETAVNSEGFQSYFRNPPVIDGPTTNPYIKIDRRDILQFSTGNYLGIATDPEIERQVAEANFKFGLTASGSRWVCGTQTPHIELEKTIADYQGEQDAVLFFLVTVASAGAIGSVMNPPWKLIKLATGANVIDEKVITEVFVDHYSHPSLTDAFKVADITTVYEYRHCDMWHLEKKLKKSFEMHGGTRVRRMIVTDGVFSAEGDLAPLPDIVTLAEKYQCMVCVDDSHATGVFGLTGRGTWEHFNVQEKIDVKLGSLAKAFAAGMGGFVTGDASLMKLIRSTAHHYIFGGSIPPAVAVGAREIILKATNESWRRQSVLANAEYLRVSLKSLGYDTFTSQSQIVPILIGDETKALEISRAMLEHGILAPCFRFPAAAIGKARIRLNVMATHTIEQLNQFVDVFDSIFKKMS